MANGCAGHWFGYGARRERLPSARRAVTGMQAGFVLPGGPIEDQLDLAVAAEAAGWDAVFVWEGAYHRDAWCLLAAMAGRTERIKLGTMLTPLPWRRPWEVAAQAATVDQLSGGRVILSVGLGADPSRATRADPQDRRTRAELLDEGLEIIQRLWRGEWTFEGQHYSLDLSPEPPRDLRPVQPRGVPIWVVGGWNRTRSMERAARYSGVIPYLMGVEPDQAGDAFAEMSAWVRAHPHPDGTVADIIWEAETPADDAAAAEAEVTRWRDRGATWWLESRWGTDPQDLRARIDAGPPRPG